MKSQAFYFFSNDNFKSIYIHFCHTSLQTKCREYLRFFFSSSNCTWPRRCLCMWWAVDYSNRDTERVDIVLDHNMEHLVHKLDEWWFSWELLDMYSHMMLMSWWIVVCKLESSKIEMILSLICSSWWFWDFFLMIFLNLLDVVTRSCWMI